MTLPLAMLLAPSLRVYPVPILITSCRYLSIRAERCLLQKGGR